MKRVGYWVNEKKDKALNLGAHLELFRNAGINLIKIDIDKPMEEQGPFDLIFHKLTNLMVKAEMDAKAAKQVKNFLDFINCHPETILVDRFGPLKKLTSRHEQYKLLQECRLRDDDSCIHTPAFVELKTSDVNVNMRKLKEAGVQFPFVCKPLVAHGTSISHKMCIIFNDAGLKDVQPPCVAQTFINHNAILYKVFVIGNQQFVSERPSLKNFNNTDLDTINFDSGDISKPHCANNALTKLDEEDRNQTPIKPDTEKLKELGQVISQKLGIELLGIDVIIESANKRYAVIDINAFPGYEGVDGFIKILCNRLAALLYKQTSDRKTKHNGHHLDSIEDSCDRRKRLKTNNGEGHVCNSVDQTTRGVNTSVSDCSEIQPVNGCVKPAQ